MILNTLPISHYVDKVRWCMDKARIPYEEEKDIGIFWVLTTGRLVPTLNIPSKNISISNSSDILKYLYAHLRCSDEEGAKFLEPTPKSFELEKKIDLLAGHIRTYMYYHTLVANKNSDELALKVSMISLFAHKVAQPTKWRFLPKNLNQLVIFVNGLAFT